LSTYLEVNLVALLLPRLTVENIRRVVTKCWMENPAIGK
jgi:hypothetical protein